MNASKPLLGRLNRVLLLLLPFLLLLLLMAATNPYKLPLAVLPLPFLLLGVGIYRLISFMLRTARLSPKRAKLISGITTAVVLMIAILMSIGQLNIKDFLILLVLLSGLTIYIQRIDTR